MVIRCRTLLGTLFAIVSLHASAGHLVIGGGVGVFYGVPWAHGLYDPWFSCMPPYLCRDPFQIRMELERDRRLQELRERATPPRTYGPGDGPWGQERYIPPPTPEANIQPAYRGTGRLRPEYEQSAQPVGEPATGSLKR